MTIEEKRKAVADYCKKRWDDGHNCSNSTGIPACPFYMEMADNECDVTENETVFNRNYEALVKLGLIQGESSEMVNHPNHYNNGGMECIDEMVLIFGKGATMHFCLCNAWKYRYRANAKNGQEDLDKANWYIAKYKELKESM